MSIREKLIRRYGESEAERKEKREKNETRDEVRRLRRELTPKSHTAGKVVSMVAKGFGDVGKSLATPYSKKRPKIANLSMGKPDIANQPDLGALRDELFGKDLRRKR